MHGGAERGISLGGALLDLTEVGDGFGERGDLDDQLRRRECPVLGEVAVGGDDPRGVPEVVPDRGWSSTCWNESR